MILNNEEKPHYIYYRPMKRIGMAKIGGKDKTHEEINLGV
jgi:hypothetical protein